MRDLTARLRAIVRTPASESARELTYVADLGMPVQSIDAGAVARELDGEVRTRRGGSFVAIDRTWDAMDFHGKRRVGSYEIVPTAPLTLFDPRLAEVADWASRIVFFDIETTGLSGGAGTLAFLVGCGWFEGDSFRVRQFFLHGPAGERAMPVALGWHPWFRKPERMEFSPSAHYPRDDEGMATLPPAPPPTGPWDDCFVNTSPVILHLEGRRVRLTSDCRHWVVYDEPAHATCVEPQSGPPDAFNLEPLVLAPGETLQRWFLMEWL